MVDGEMEMATHKRVLRFIVVAIKMTYFIFKQRGTGSAGRSWEKDGVCGKELCYEENVLQGVQKTYRTIKKAIRRQPNGTVR